MWRCQRRRGISTCWSSAAIRLQRCPRVKLWLRSEHTCVLRRSREGLTGNSLAAWFGKMLVEDAFMVSDCVKRDSSRLCMFDFCLWLGRITLQFLRARLMMLPSLFPQSRYTWNTSIFESRMEPKILFHLAPDDWHGQMFNLVPSRFLLYPRPNALGITLHRLATRPGVSRRC